MSGIFPTRGSQGCSSPPCLAAYVVLRGAAATRAFTNLELLERSPAWPGWYRHVPAAALIVALAL